MYGPGDKISFTNNRENSMQNISTTAAAAYAQESMMMQS